MSSSMLSVVIETRNQDVALARTLASLVGGAVEGLVREVIVCDHGSTDETSRVAEQAGCLFIAGQGAEAGIRQARSDWLLLLEPGARLMDGWMDDVMSHAEGASGAARFTPVRQSKIAGIMRWFRLRGSLAEGLMITRREALALMDRSDNVGSIARSVSSRRLGAGIMAAPA